MKLTKPVAKELVLVPDNMWCFLEDYIKITNVGKF